MVSIKLFLWSHERPAHLPSVGEQILAQVHTLQTSCRVVEHSSRSEAALVSSAPTLRLMILLILSLTTLVSWYCLTQCDVTIYSVTLSIIILLILFTLTTVINSICVSVLPAERLWSWWWCSDGGLLHWDTTSVIICQWPGDEVMRWNMAGHRRGDILIQSQPFAFIIITGYRWETLKKIFVFTKYF